MVLYDRILLPYDGSEGASPVLHHASEIAHRFDAEITVLYVADTNRDSVTIVESGVVDALMQEGESIVEEAEKTLETLGTTYRSDVVQGDPGPAIATYAKEMDQDLVVTPTHGREGLSRFLFGSVTDTVVRLSATPVLSVRMHDRDRLEFPYETLLVPTDGSEQAQRAARHALTLAAAIDADVHTLSVAQDAVLGPDVLSPTVEEAAQTAAKRATDSVVEVARDVGDVTVHPHVEEGEAVPAILDAIETHDVDAVVMGATGKRGTDRILLGSVAEKTIRSAPVPVLTVGSDTASS